MTTLSAQIDSIKASKMSKSNMKKAMLALGITSYEADLLTADIVTIKGASYTFGVEIEMLAPRHAIIERSEANGLNIRYEGYNHRDNKSYFKFVSDSSICGENPIECVSPVLSSKSGFATLKNACKTINEAGAMVNRSTGLHVHIGADGLTDDQYTAVFVNYQHLEGVIDSFMARSRRGNNSQWCHTLQGIGFVFGHDKASLALAMGSRYYKVNPCSYARHKTIEFRQHQGTTDYKKISMWVKFCAKLVNWSKTHTLTEDVTSIDDIAFLTKAEKDFFKGRAEQLA